MYENRNNKCIKSEKISFNFKKLVTLATFTVIQTWKKSLSQRKDLDSAGAIRTSSIC